MENNDRQTELKFQRFFTTYFPKVKNFAQMLLKSDSDAEDVAQEVFCKLWPKPEIWLDNEQEPDNYVFTMTRNIVLNIFKHQQIEREYQAEVEKAILHELAENEEALNNVYYKEMLMIIRLTLEKMPKRRKLIFELSRFQGLSHKEIAEKLDVSIRTVEHQVYLALVELKKMLLLFIFFLFF
ncbi:RNA polymerase sigma-70 factor (ECF subfamily) [Bacteroides zoogleoformans]|uniref:RNA polymerase sigma-70 factor n=1 Tax=Bacteroides zoogleoformans TaxID=28119 RepID=A0ABM6T8P7_9BACE|nr:RNA polymerase sigma-70 factor [Bacteroides zoogleoformans]AVM53064.1 RNA polymerase sigma-70 factor [Bacteroides zoogleoformans]TWJ13164.1 RNA polymerase sigma-70 factor (ECF subfamily) [Bacteroides zoogleoformans]